MGYSITGLCNGCGACVKVCPTNAITGMKKNQHAISPARCIECGACGRICPQTAVLDDAGKKVERVKKADWLRPVIDRQRCRACENCVGACPSGALTMYGEELPLTRNRAVLAYPDKCVSCGWCREHCLFDAITLGAAS